MKIELSLRGLPAACAALPLCFALAAHAGPPFITDDPEPTDTGDWESIISRSGAHVPGITAGQAGFDLNYGAAENLQLTTVIPLGFQSQGQLGLGDIELAAKYRFLHQSESTATPDVSFFPRVFVPTGGHQFGSGRATCCCPYGRRRTGGPGRCSAAAGTSSIPAPGIAITGSAASSCHRRSARISAWGSSFIIKPQTRRMPGRSPALTLA